MDFFIFEIKQLQMRRLSENVEKRVIVLSTHCHFFNESNLSDSRIGYFLVPFVFLGDDRPNHIHYRFLEFLDQQKPNWNESSLRNGNYLRNFLINSGNSDYPFICAYRVPKRLIGKLHFLPIEVSSIGSK